MPQTRRLKEQKCNFSQFWGLEFQDQGASQVGFILKPLLFTCKWLPSRYIFTRPFLFARLEREREREEGRGKGWRRGKEGDGGEGERGGSWCLFLQRHLSHHEGPTLMISSNPYYLPETPISKYHHIGS